MHNSNEYGKETQRNSLNNLKTKTCPEMRPKFNVLCKMHCP